MPKARKPMRRMKPFALAAVMAATLCLLVPETAEAGRYRRALRRAYRPVVAPVVVAPRRAYVAPRRVVGYRGYYGGGFYGGGVRVGAPGVGVFIGF